MVVLTIVAQKNGETIYFDQPFPKVHFMKLLSYSLYNSWDTLKNEGLAGLDDRKLNPSGKISKLAAGHYDLDTLAKKKNKSALKYTLRWVSSRSKYPSWAVDDQSFW